MKIIIAPDGQRYTDSGLTSYRAFACSLFFMCAGDQHETHVCAIREENGEALCEKIDHFLVYGDTFTDGSPVNIMNLRQEPLAAAPDPVVMPRMKPATAPKPKPTEEEEFGPEGDPFAE